MTDKDFFDQLQKNRTACKEETCRETDLNCECFLTAVQLKPLNGRAVNYHTGQTYDQQIEDTFVLADGNHSKIVILLNGRFPGPPITAYEYQDIIVHVRNLLHTDAVTIHWHGMQQKGTPWSDGVAFVSQCPILPGQNVTYKFKGKPFGTSFYHAHIGDQRTMGLYGPLIILPMSGQNISQPQEGINVFVVAIQDWNHNDDADVLYQKMLVGDYDMNTGRLYNTTSDLSGAMCSNQSNGSPLTKFVVQSNQTYRFRVISAATLYPFRVFVQQHQPIYIVASDGFEIEKVPVESFIINPGERIDFLMVANQNPGTYLLVAETLEVEAKQRNQYNVAEAIIFYNTSQNKINLNPPKAKEEVCLTTCTVFNCPFEYYPTAENRRCLSLNDVRSADPNSQTEDVEGEAIEHFFNFVFPGDKGYTTGSVNGHQFRSPSVGAYEHLYTVDYKCDACNETTICECTYAATLDSPNKDKIYQFVLTNIGNGSGWSHPIHLHGHSFYVMKMAFGKYDKTSGRLVQNQVKENVGEDVAVEVVVIIAVGPVKDEETQSEPADHVVNERGSGNSNRYNQQAQVGEVNPQQSIYRGGRQSLNMIRFLNKWYNSIKNTCECLGISAAVDHKSHQILRFMDTVQIQLAMICIIGILGVLYLLLFYILFKI
ncbi:unnamed protein product [Mytilus edulis]|uniref:Uncharacterized protein n=1 Tax=Mytilus edulis TaxID=6550 RepID=A0A8S3Q098_MYTED|nr:unnamed protein product [Mytilus edulis]